MTYLKAFFRWLLTLFYWPQSMTQRIQTQKVPRPKIKESKITIKRYGPVYPDIRENRTYTVDPSILKSEAPPPPKTYSNPLERTALMCTIKRTFFGDTRRVDHAIRQMRKKYPTLNELEILRKMDDEYRIKRG